MGQRGEEACVRGSFGHCKHALFRQGGNALRPRCTIPRILHSQTDSPKTAVQACPCAAFERLEQSGQRKRPVETYDPDAILAERRAAVIETLRRVDADEVRAFLEEIFTDRQSHPWFKPFHDFVDEHAAQTFLRAEPEPGITVIYHPSAHAGMWCRRGDKLEGVGRLHGRGLDAMKSLAEKFLADPS